MKYLCEELKDKIGKGRVVPDSDSEVKIIMNFIAEWLYKEAAKESLIEGFENTYATKKLTGLAKELKDVR